MAHIAGFAVINDLSEREFQLEHGGQWVKGKSCDTFGPIGPWLVTPDEVADPQNLPLWLEVNGHRYQNGNTRTMVFGVAHLVSYISRYMTLLPGDVISTGTPAGVGLGLKPPTYLRAGDVIELGIEGLGRQRQQVLAHPAATRHRPGPRLMTTITALETHDIRFPTSLALDGSDAMNPDPDYSAAYLILRTDSADGLAGHGLVFTIGRGNDVQTAALEALRPMVVGREVAEVTGDLGAFARGLTGDSQLRWLGPEKGVMHMAIGAVINAAWDMAARAAGKPLWRYIADMTPAQIVSQVDFRYLTDALTPEQALAILRAAEPGKRARIEQLLAEGYPAYTTSPGWLGYPDEKTRAPRPRSRRRRFPHDQAEGRPQRRGRYPPLPPGARDRGSGYRHRRGCQPALGRADRDRLARVRSRMSAWPGSRSRPAPTMSLAMRRSAAASRRSPYRPASTRTTG